MLFRLLQGFYGEVYKGTLEYLGNEEVEPRMVAVKKLKANAVASCLQDFEREINIMKVVNLWKHVFRFLILFIAISDSEASEYCRNIGCVGRS